MIKLNNKGISSIEILVCFVIVAAITITLFDVITNYKTKQQIESYKSSLVEYKNKVSNVINDDIVKYKLGTISTPVITNNVNNYTYNVTLYFKKNLLTNTECLDFMTNPVCQKELKVTKYIEVEDNDINTMVDSIAYQEVVNGTKRNVLFPLIDIGTSIDSDTNKIVKNLRFASVSLYNKLDNFFFEVTMYHHELSTDYNIKVVAPINYY